MLHCTSYTIVNYGNTNNVRIWYPLWGPCSLSWLSSRQHRRQVPIVQFVTYVLLSFPWVQIFIFGLQSQTFRTRVLSRGTDPVSWRNIYRVRTEIQRCNFLKAYSCITFHIIHIATTRNSYVIILPMSEFVGSLCNDGCAVWIFREISLLFCYRTVE